ncbi:MAG: cell division protein SepF [Oscillospiraceae bacterium]|jgi:cell division inhibitor SepF|nr:cell division protein SepF [Oscillospiraceae bacterium]MDY4190680.1 cell division protein SepF [Oscillospiraceae bacterium]
MGLMAKFKEFMGFPEEDYEDEEYEEEEYLPHEEFEKSERADRGPAYADSGRRNKVVNIHATTQLQVVLVKPERFDDARSVADHLNEKRTVVLNLESTNKDVSRRLIDFLSGVAYANNGQIQRVANSTYIITPYNVDIMGDLLDELENNGVFF